MARILVVDDAVFMRTILRDILSEADHEVVGEAATGEDAVERFKELRPDLVTMDLVMPGAGGIEALSRILDVDADARVIIVSAVGQREDVEAALDVGASDFLTKPFEKEKVVATVESVLSTVTGREAR